MPDEPSSCGALTPLTDAELAGILRAAADDKGLTCPFVMIAIDAWCVLAGDHEEHADYVAIPGGGTSTDRVWLRWDSADRRTLELLGDCAADGKCVLFAGHGGDCDFDSDEEGVSA
jgi:hypothetical protein